MARLEDINPQLPAGYDVTWTVVVLGSIIVIVVAVALIARAVARR